MMPALASDALLSSGDMPPTAMAWSTPGIPWLIRTTSSMTRSVRSRDAPSGSCTETIT